jgi:hypothetical protein
MRRHRVQCGAAVSRHERNYAGRVTASAALSTRGARVLRGLAAGAVATAAAATSHSLSGGTLNLDGLAVAATFAAIVSIALAGRSLSLVRLSTSVLVSQLAFHLAFSDIGTGDTVVRMGHHAMVVGTDVGAEPRMDVAMWVGHAIAALVTVVLLRHGETAFWRLREIVLFALRLWLLPASELPLANSRPTATVELPRLFLLRRAALKYRGPPAIRFA